jgi:hypothetical protein
MAFLINGQATCGICRKKDVAFLMKRIDYGEVNSILCMKCFDECKEIALENIRKQDV